jgi:sugar lactone lactonase YvrE
LVHLNGFGRSFAMSMSLLVSDFVLPNWLAFTPDEKMLYINDSRRRHIRAFELLPNGTLAKQTDRVFADLQGSEPGVPDGMKVDMEGSGGNLDHGSAWQEARPHRPRRSRHHRGASSPSP